MGLATEHKWEGSLIGESLDGMDMWYSITSGADSPHSEIIHYMDEYLNCSFQLNMFKLDMNDFATNTWQFPERFFTEDQRPELKVQVCPIPSLTGYLDSLVLDTVEDFSDKKMKSSKAMKAGKPMKYATPEAAAAAIKAAKPYKAQRAALQNEKIMNLQAMAASSMTDRGVVLLSFAGMLVFLIGVFYGVSTLQKRQLMALSERSYAK
jgi:hypothetical protein